MNFIEVKKNIGLDGLEGHTGVIINEVYEPSLEQPKVYVVVFPKHPIFNTSKPLILTENDFIRLEGDNELDGYVFINQEIKIKEDSGVSADSGILKKIFDKSRNEIYFIDQETIKDDFSFEISIHPDNELVTLFGAEIEFM